MRIDDLAVIREMGKGLGRIHKAFEGLPDIVESYGEDFGHDHELAKAIREAQESGKRGK
jgi:hypothetical protein